MTLHRPSIALSIGALALPLLVTSPTSSAAIDPSIITLLRESGANVEAIGSTPGLTGYHVTREGDATDPGYTLYVTASGHAVAGVLYGPDGVVLTVDQLRTAEMRDSRTGTQTSAQARVPDASGIALDPASPAPPVVPLGDFAAAHTPPPPTTGFSLGQAGPVVQIFADPTCSFSRGTVARFATAALGGKVQLTVIPVALLGADSAFQALAAIDGGGEAWFDRVSAEPTPVTAAAVRQNNAAHAATGINVVPVIRTFSADGAWHDHAGAVSDVASFLEAAQ